MVYIYPQMVHYRVPSKYAGKSGANDFSNTQGQNGAQVSFGFGGLAGAGSSGQTIGQFSSFPAAQFATPAFASGQTAVGWGARPSLEASPALGVHASSTSVVVSTPGSGLVFDNTYTANCTAQYEACIVAAEDQLESLISTSDTIVVTFDEANSGNNGVALGNSSTGWNVSYASLRAALLKVAPGDVLPTTDPSGGANWYVPASYARMLGLQTYVGSPDLSVTLNTYYGWDYGQDVINGLTHELTEGGLGRIGGLGGTSGGGGGWSTMDLFRYNAQGQADYSNGRDGKATYFSANGGTTLSNANLANKGAPTLSYNNQYNSNGTLNNTGDTADWVQNSVFGSTGGGETLAMTQTELNVLQALGWNITLKQDVDVNSGLGRPPAIGAPAPCRSRRRTSTSVDRRSCRSTRM